MPDSTAGRARAAFYVLKQICLRVRQPGAVSRGQMSQTDRGRFAILTLQEITQIEVRMVAIRVQLSWPV